MNLPHERRLVIDITDSDDDEEVRLEDLMSPEELQAAVNRSLALDLIPDAPLPPNHHGWSLHRFDNVPTSTVTPYDQCLRKVQEVFPDVSIDYVKNLYDRHPPKTPSPDAIPISEEIISQILDSANYPKERDRQNELKRKRADSDEERAAQWAAPKEISDPNYGHDA